MARIYIATSWKNMDRQKLVQELREHGHKVYEFRRYSGEGDMPVLEEISLKYGLGEKYRTKTLEPGEYEKIIFDKKARMCFSLHAPAIEKADICILLLPAGRSAHIEAGLLSGRGTKVIVYDSGQYTKAELAYGYFDGYTSDKEELFRMLEEPIPGVCRVCGCTGAAGAGAQSRSTYASAAATFIR